MAETIHTYIVKDEKDMKVSIEDWLVDEYCVTIGTSNCIKLIGDLNALSQIAVMIETLVEIEGMRKRKNAIQDKYGEDFREERKRALGE